METVIPDVHQEAPNILVVDDTPANLHLLTGMLKDHGYRVRPVPSGKLAIQAAQNERPDLVLLDINMPDMNGYEVCGHLRADPAFKGVPVLFISALDETLDKTRAFAAGGVDYITKPFQFEEVEARVRTHLALRQLQIDLEVQNHRLRDSYDQLKTLEELRDNLTHMIVHDMRSPLMAIMLGLDSHKQRAAAKLDKREMKSILEVAASVDRLVEMVSSLLDVSRMEQGKMPLHMATCDLDVLIADALDSLGLLAGRVSLLHQKQPLPVMIKCDASLITRVIANLVGNAIKFTPQGNKVTISAQSNGHGTRCSVVDTGYGIPSEYHRKIFDKFGQVDARQQGKVYSTGLGLAFCKLAVEAHGGNIGVESEVDKGSTFWFTVPS